MKKTLIIVVVLFLSLNAFAQSSAKRLKEFNLENKIAVQGHDPVSYFTDKKAVKGKSSLSVSHEGVVYHFSSQKNKDLFLKNPAKYEPQYGGWCAFAMGDYGEKVEVDPQTFKIIDGKLYLFYNAYFNNTLRSWNKNEANLKRKADVNWQKFQN